MALQQLLLLLIHLANATQALRTLRVITWNVKDNSWMDGTFKETALRQILGIEAFLDQPKAFYDIYAITLQENCHLCDSTNFWKLGDIFVGLLNSENRFTYQQIGHSATRVSQYCQGIACGTGQHGSTHMIVIAKRGMGSHMSVFHTNKCTDGWLRNSEKGIATVKFHLRGTKRNICVSGLHLDSNSPSLRRQCFEQYVSENGGHIADCNVTILAGDFNTRTGDKGGDKRSRKLYLHQVEMLKKKDEMSGVQPYQGKRLFDFIVGVFGRRFSEGPLNFPPTYSLRSASECGGSPWCYRGDRPPSWTDRIICDHCNIFAYNGLPIFHSDHIPVVAVYTI